MVWLGTIGTPILRVPLDLPDPTSTPALPPNRPLWRRLFESAQTPVRYDWFVPDEVARYDAALDQGHPMRLDDDTWFDLELDRYLDLLAARCSIFGRQMLYHRLRCGGGPAASSHDEGAQQAAAPALAGLLLVDTEVTGVLFHGDIPRLPGWTRWLGLLAWGFPAAAAVWALAGAMPGGLALALVLVLSARAQIALHGPMMLWHRQRRALLAMLDAAGALTAAADPLRNDVLRLRQALGPGWVEHLPAVADYANLLALYQYRKFGRELARLGADLPALQRIYRQVAGAEADLAVRQHLGSTALTCMAQPAPPGELELQDVVHPLVQPSHALSLRLQGHGALITGCNGAGKSTLLRTVGLNVVVARAFGFCYARSARVPAVTVLASLQVQDCLRTATSLYMAELDRARALSRAAQQATPVLVLIDEIFRGTNHLESVAATAALAQVLAWLQAYMAHPIQHPRLGGAPTAP